MSVSMAADPEITILSRVIGEADSTLSQAVAEEFLRWTFTDFDRQRMSDLAAKARSGELTPQEQAEAEGYERVGSFLGVVKSKARRALQAANGR